MAKDKGGKTATKSKGKASKDAKPDKSKGKGKGGFALPSEAPNTGGDGWKFEDDKNVGSLFLITPLRVETVKTDKYGDAEVVVADIVELNEKKPAKSEAHEEVYIFGGWTKGATRGYIDESKVLGRLGQDASKSKSDKPAWVLEDPDDDDIAVASEYITGLDLFAKPGKDKGAKSAKADKGKSKGKGKSK